MMRAKARVSVERVEEVKEEPVQPHENDDAVILTLPPLTPRITFPDSDDDQSPHLTNIMNAPRRSSQVDIQEINLIEEIKESV